MRPATIRLIFLRELRDQLRDRRTIFMIAVLPIVLYPLLGLLVVQVAIGYVDRPSTIGIVGSEHLPLLSPASAGLSPLPAVAWLSATPGPQVTLDPDLERTLGAAALAYVRHTKETYPPFVIDGKDLHVPRAYLDPPLRVSSLKFRQLENRVRLPLEEKTVDVILTVPADFLTTLDGGNQPALSVAYRATDEGSRLAYRRLMSVLDNWKKELREVRLMQKGLPAGFDEPVAIKDLEKSKPADELASEGLIDILVRIFPFLLVVFSLVGAFYPAVDLCAGEKERGTMETLLISPASRTEIVLGKFMTIWLFSAATAFLNLASMGMTTTLFGAGLTHDILRPAAIFWCVVLALPLSAFFSAISLAVGAYARSSKEGQYYLMPLFLVTLPLILLTLAPGVNLGPFYSLVPVTGVALLLRRLMTASLRDVPWPYFIPVLVPIVLYSWLALRWAIEQFKREEVLFREAERLELGLWLKRLFREKEPLPSLGQALFCFGLIVGMRMLFLKESTEKQFIFASAITYVASVIAPPLLMAFFLTTLPQHGLALRLTGLKSIVVAGLLAVLVLLPLGELTELILSRVPELKTLLQESNPLVKELAASTAASRWQYVLVLGLMPALFEEIAFRGFILTGLRRRLNPWGAILLSALLFALYQLNVFTALPMFLLGIILALLTIWSDSVLPAIFFHLVYNAVLIGLSVVPSPVQPENLPFLATVRILLTAMLTVLALSLLVFIGRGLQTEHGLLTSADFQIDDSVN
jgi:sodium transport system permease protein